MSMLQTKYTFPPITHIFTVVAGFGSDLLDELSARDATIEGLEERVSKV